MNSGGPDFTDGVGNLFEADRPFVAGDFGMVGGTAGTFTGDILGTTDDALYQTLVGGSAVSYIFDSLPSGDYTVTLYFMEPIWTNPGERVFDVLQEGAIVLNNYDIVGAAGAELTAVTETFVSTVNDGQLNIDLVGVTRLAIISGIAVVPGP